MDKQERPAPWRRMMTNEDGPKIHVDDDWKAEAQAEKERMAEEEAKAADKPQAPEKPSILTIINLLATQAMVGLGGMRTPTGETIPPDPQMAQVFIDMIGVLDEKTEGNLSDEESKIIKASLHELRQNYIMVANAAGMAGGNPAPGQPE